MSVKFDWDDSSNRPFERMLHITSHGGSVVLDYEQSRKLLDFLRQSYSEQKKIIQTRIAAQIASLKEDLAKLEAEEIS